jgi:hypothetical protein
MFSDTRVRVRVHWVPSRRREVETFLGRPVYLQLSVQVWHPHVCAHVHEW